MTQHAPCPTCELALPLPERSAGLVVDCPECGGRARILNVGGILDLEALPASAKEESDDFLLDDFEDPSRAPSGRVGGILGLEALHATEPQTSAPEEEAGDPDIDEPRRNWKRSSLLWSIIALSCGSILFGTIALVFAVLAMNARNQGDFELAARYDKRAFVWIRISVMLAVALWGMLLGLKLLFD